MKIVFSKHALKDKFVLLKKHNFHLNKADIMVVIRNPDHLDQESDYPKIIASKNFDNKHIIRVVYKTEHGIIKIITFYPAEKGRYY
ncbi:MAG: DUF4258 domain-containing protein [Patescibacteria group bacterium]|nr:DUF4258 domain-containing protein [Patescibacteria group bacterium]